MLTTSGQTAGARRRRTVAVVPWRDGHSGKSRLAGRLTGEERRDVAVALAQHVVGTLLRVDLAAVLVVTRAPDFAGAALGPRARLAVVPQPAERPGLNAAVTLGRELAADQGADRLLVVHADLPLLGTTDVSALLEPGTGVVLAPDRAGSGTNALVLDASLRGFRFRFGPESRPAHVREAARLGLGTVLVERAGTRTDLDTAADWADLPAAVRDRLLRHPAAGPPAQADQ